MQVREHYIEHEGKAFYEGLVKYFCSGPALFMVWEGPDAIAGIATPMLLLAIQHNMKRTAYANVLIT
jgi:nucleoside diphosphate kinase